MRKLCDRVVCEELLLCVCVSSSPHHCVGFLFFAWIPPGLRSSAPSSSAASSSLTLITPSLPHSLTPSLPHSLTPSLPHSLTPSLPHSLTPSLPHSFTPSLPQSLAPSLPHSHSLTPSLRHSLTPSLPHSCPHSLTPSLPHSLTPSLPPSLTHSLTSRGRRSTESFLAAFRVAGAVYTEPPGSITCGARSWLPFAWPAQYTEPPGGAAACVGAAGPRLASRGRRSTESFLAAFRVAGAVHKELRRAWAPLGRSWLRVAGAVYRASWLPFGLPVHRASWRSCGARGRWWAGFA